MHFPQTIRCGARTLHFYRGHQIGGPQHLGREEGRPLPLQPQGRRRKVWNALWLQAGEVDINKEKQIRQYHLAHKKYSSSPCSSADFSAADSTQIFPRFAFCSSCFAYVCGSSWVVRVVFFLHHVNTAGNVIWIIFFSINWIFIA